MTFQSVFVSLLFLLAYYAVCAAAFALGGAGRILSALWKDKRCIPAILLLILGCTAVVVYWVRQDRFIYFWDFSVFWERSILQTNMMFVQPSLALQMLVDSIGQSDYNLLLPTIASLPQQLMNGALGSSYQTYVITNHLVFMIPAILGLSMCAVKFFGVLFPGERVSASRRFVMGTAVAVFFPAFYYVTLHGYMDVGILLPMSAVVFLLLDYDLTVPFSLRSQWRDILFSLLLILACLSRRYAAFFAVGAAAAMIFLAVIEVAACSRSSISKRAFLSSIAHLFYIGAVSTLVFLLFFRSFFLHALTTDYATAYSAYDDKFINKVLTAGEFFGLCALLSILAVALYAAAQKRGRRQAAVLLFLLAVTALSFFSVQSMSDHHRYIIAVPLYLFTAAALFLPVVKAPGHLSLLYSRVLPALCCLAFVCNWLYAYVPPARKLLAPAEPLLCSAYNPLQRDDIDQLHALRDCLAAKAKEKDTGVYVLASGYVLNDDVIRCLYMPARNSALPAMLHTNHVDLRDGFPTAFLSAGLVVTTDPIQTHLASGTQEVIEFLAQEVSDAGSPIGKHYRQCEETFPLDQGVTAYIYERVSDWEPSDIEYIRSYYSSLYPDYPGLFADRITMPSDGSIS